MELEKIITQEEKMNLIKLARFDVDLVKSFDISLLDNTFISDLDIKKLNIDDYVYAIFNLLKGEDVKNHPFINQYGVSSKMIGSSIIKRLNIPFKNGIVWLDINIANIGLVRDVVFYGHDIY